MATITCERLAMSDIAPAPVERRNDLQVLLDPRFRRLLGEVAWQQLPEPIRNRFAKIIPAGGAVVYRGEVVATKIPPAGRLLVGLARLIGSPLPLDDGATGPSKVTVTERADRGGQIWERTYTRSPRRSWAWFVFWIERWIPGAGRQAFVNPEHKQGQWQGFRADAWEPSVRVGTRAAMVRRAPRAPQVVRSTKCFTGPTGLEEQVAGGLGMALRVSVEGEQLVFRSQHYFLRLGRRRLILPALVGPGRMEIVHTQLPDGHFSFALTLTHPRWGLLLRQVAYFSDP